MVKTVGEKPRLKAQYKEKAMPEMMAAFGYKNKLAVPKIEKVVLNMGLGKAVIDSKIFSEAEKNLSLVSGQKPAVTRAKAAIAGFKLRQGMPIGQKVTLRGARMYEFLDKLVAVVLPRVRDFRGLSPKADGHGSYSIGLRDIAVFPELAEKEGIEGGVEVTIKTTAKGDTEAIKLLGLLGFPFKSNE